MFNYSFFPEVSFISFLSVTNIRIFKIYQFYVMIKESANVLLPNLQVRIEILIYLAHS